MIPNYWNDFKITQVNMKKPRAYMIPFSDKQAAMTLSREHSDRLTLLNGEWSFKHYPSVQYIEDEFFACDYPLFDTVMPVPGIWQTNGCDTTAYVSSPYPFMYRETVVPKTNPAGVYLRDFTFKKKEGRQYEIVFEGVDSCLYLYLNGKFIGYGEISHNAKIFDITNDLVDGKNRIAALVLKRSTAAYFEDQDKLRMSGIYRDVYILERDESRIEDFYLRQDTSCDKATLSCELEAVGACDITVTLLSPDGEIIETKNAVDGKAVFNIVKPQLWSSEAPTLYGVLIACGGEVFYKRLGFRRVEVKEGVFLVNGKGVKLLGVNRHDSHPEKGYAVSYEDMLNDILLMKGYNINAIRTSHSSNDPRFYEICDRLGLYVIAEADYETHGWAYIKPLNAFMAEEQYAHISFERNQANVESFKNNCSVIIWSLGNESSWGANHQKTAKWIRERTSDRLIHCETNNGGADYNSTEWQETEKPYLDMYSLMYPSFEHMDRFIASSDGRPLVLCEYTHAMGNSSGDAYEYVEKFFSNDRFMGGCVWEWADHAIKMKDANGNAYFGYGGDFGDNALNLGNFCADGLNTPDRKPHSAMLEIKNAYSPIKITGKKHVAGDSIYLTVENRYRFKTLAHLNIKWHIKVDGEICDSGILKLDTQPQTSIETMLTCKTLYGEAYLYINAYDGDSKIYAYSQRLESLSTPVEVPNGALSVSENGYSLTVSGEKFAYTFSKLKPIITSIKYGRELLTSPTGYSLWRAPIDNDRYIRDDWSKEGFLCKEGNLAYPISDIDRIAYTQDDSGVKITYSFFIGCMGKAPIAFGTMTASVYGNGLLILKQSGSFRKELNTYLPRYGYLWNIDKALNNMKYLGYGPQESYCDKHHGAIVDVFVDKTTARIPNYVKPQESNNVFGTRFATLCDGDGFGITFFGDTFNFNASRFTDIELASKRHTAELMQADFINVHTDYRQIGVGSGACGPQIADKYKFSHGDFDFTLGISPKPENEFEMLKLFDKLK